MVFRCFEDVRLGHRSSAQGLARVPTQPAVAARAAASRGRWPGERFAGALEVRCRSRRQGLRGELHSALREERLKREVTGTGMAEQVQAWEELCGSSSRRVVSGLPQAPAAVLHGPYDPAGRSGPFLGAAGLNEVGGRGLRDSEMNMARLAEMLRCSQDSELSARVEDVPDILRDSQVTSES